MRRAGDFLDFGPLTCHERASDQKMRGIPDVWKEKAGKVRGWPQTGLKAGREA